MKRIFSMISILQLEVQFHYSIHHISSGDHERKQRGVDKLRTGLNKKYYRKPQILLRTHICRRIG